MQTCYLIQELHQAQSRGTNYPDIKKIGECVHIFNPVRILFPQLIKNRKGFVDIWKKEDRVQSPTNCSPSLLALQHPCSLTSDIVIGNCDLGNNVWALGEAHINEMLILLQGLLYQLQLCVYMSQEEFLHPGVRQRQELQLAPRERDTLSIIWSFSQSNTEDHYVLKGFITKILMNIYKWIQGNPTESDLEAY